MDMGLKITKNGSNMDMGLNSSKIIKKESTWIWD